MSEHVSSDTFPSINFDSLHSQAMAHDSTPVSETPETPAAEPAVSAEPAPGTTPTTPDAVDVSQKTEAQLAQIADDQLVEVIVDGQPVQMPWKDARAGISRTADYTRKLQSLSRERQEFESQRAPLAQAKQQLDAFVQVFNDRDALTKLLEAKYPDLVGRPAQQAAAAIQAQQPGAIDPEEIATVGQVQSFITDARQMIAQEIAAAQHRLRQEIGSATREVEDNLEVAKHTATINATVNEIFSADPLISKLIPNAEALLRWNVQQMVTEQTTPAEVVEMFKTVAAGWSDEIKAAMTEHNKTAVVNKQKLVDNNIQPPGGSPVVPTPTDFKDASGKVDWKKVTDLALAYGSK